MENARYKKVTIHIPIDTKVILIQYPFIAVCKGAEEGVDMVMVIDQL